jgi:hypothetical protein
MAPGQEATTTTWGDHVHGAVAVNVHDYVNDQDHDHDHVGGQGGPRRGLL